MAELADARDLKSREINISYRFDPGFRHHYIAGWSSSVARRAHNPKVVRFKSHSRNQKNSGYPLGCPEFFPFGRGRDSVPHALRGYEPERFAQRANNLRPKSKRLISVLTTVDAIKQGVGRAECIEATGDDNATGADGRDTALPCFKSHSRNPKNQNQYKRPLLFR